MCAMFRERKPEKKNGRHAGLKATGAHAAAVPQSTAWEHFVGLQAARLWMLR